MARPSRLTTTLLASLLLPAAHAASFTVTSTADNGAGSLRAALISANDVPSSAHTITFVPPYPNGGTIALQSALPLIVAQNLTISGGTRSPTISGQNLHQILRVSGDNANLDISDVAFLSGRSASNGGCIEDEAMLAATTGTLRLTRTVFSGCSASADSLVHGGAVYWRRSAGPGVFIASSRFSINTVEATLPNGQSAGGAIYSRANTSIADTLFENNAAKARGKGSFGGAIHLAGDNRSLSVSDSTFRGNAAAPAGSSQDFGNGGAISMNADASNLQIARSYFRANVADVGGAVFSRKASSGAIDVGLTLTNNTFVNNSVISSGGAVYVFKILLTLANNTFYNNDATDGAHLTFGFSNASLVYALGNLFGPAAFGPACSGTAVRPNPGLIDANLFSDASCGSVSATSLPNSPLGTITIDETPGMVGVVRFTGSAVIDSIASNAQCEPRDARFQQRPIDGNGDGLARCDVGAYEHPNTVVFRNGFEN